MMMPQENAELLTPNVELKIPLVEGADLEA